MKNTVLQNTRILSVWPLYNFFFLKDLKMSYVVNAEDNL